MKNGFNFHIIISILFIPRNWVHRGYEEEKWSFNLDG